MKKYPNISNQEALKLIEQYQLHQQQDVLGKLYAPYMKMVYAIGLKYFKTSSDAEDLVMKVYEKLGKKLQTNQIENFSSWLYTVAKNECLMELRKTTKEIPTEKIATYQEKFVENEQTMHLFNENSRDDTTSALKHCLEQLKKEQKLCITSFYYDGQSYKEIEATTGITLKQVKSNIQNGKRNLKQCLQQKNATH